MGLRGASLLRASVTCFRELQVAPTQSGIPSPRATGLSRAGGRFALRTPPPSADCGASALSAWSGALGGHLRSPRRDKNPRTGLGALGCPGSSLPPSLSSTLRFGEDFRAVLFSLLPSIFIFRGSDSSLALGVEIRWRDQISARLCVRAVCVPVCVCSCVRVFHKRLRESALFPNSGGRFGSLTGSA